MLKLMLNVKYLIPEINTVHENVQRSVPEWGLSCANLWLRDDVRNRKDTDAQCSFLPLTCCDSSAVIPTDQIQVTFFILRYTTYLLQYIHLEKKKKIKKKIFEKYGKKQIQTLLQPGTAKSRSGKRLVACCIQILDQSSYILLESISRRTTTLPMAEPFLTAVTLTWSYKSAKGEVPQTFHAISSGAPQSWCLT